MMKNLSGILVRVSLLAVIVALILPVTGCNTMRGLGKDIQALGGTLDKTAEETKRDLTD